MSPVVETKLSNTTIIITKENLNRVSIGVLEYLKYDRETPHTDSYESSAYLFICVLRLKLVL